MRAVQCAVCSVCNNEAFTQRHFPKAHTQKSIAGNYGVSSLNALTNEKLNAVATKLVVEITSCPWSVTI